MKRRKPGKLVGGYGQREESLTTLASLNLTPIGVTVTLQAFNGTRAPAGGENAALVKLCEVLILTPMGVKNLIP